MTRSKRGGEHDEEIVREENEEEKVGRMREDRGGEGRGCREQNLVVRF